MNVIWLPISVTIGLYDSIWLLCYWKTEVDLYTPKLNAVITVIFCDHFFFIFIIWIMLFHYLDCDMSPPFKFEVHLITSSPFVSYFCTFVCIHFGKEILEFFFARESISMFSVCMRRGKEINRYHGNRYVYHIRSLFIHLYPFVLQMK